jgi:gliding motility-associated-like protein
MFRPKPCYPLFLLLVLLSLTHRSMAQVSCTAVFVNEYRGTGGGPLQPHAVKALPDGTLLVAGRAALVTSSTYDGFVSKHAADGTPVWTFFLGGAGNDDFTGITPLTDGSFMLYGTTSSFGYPGGKGWLVHIDANGAVLWSGQLGATGTGTDRIKTVQQYTDGDIVGSFNANDSSAASDPVIFKMGLDGTLRWTHRFDNGNDDSYTTLAISGDTVYAGGYYSSGGMKLAVLTEVGAATGADLLSRNLNNGDATLNEEVNSLEIYNNIISYGIYVTKGSSYSATNALVYVQTDLAGNNRSVTYAQDPQGLSPLKAIRTPDGGFMVLRTNEATVGYPSLYKVNAYGYMDWGLALQNFGIFSTADVFPDGGTITAGHYLMLTGGFGEGMNLTRATARGEIGSCNISAGRLNAGPSGYQTAAFTWAAEPLFPVLSAVIAPVSAPDPLTVLSSSCASSVCTDQTPIPAGCGKTYNIQYTSERSSLLRDVIATTDGGRVAVGNLMNTIDDNAFAQLDGLVTKYQSNGSIAWTKNYNIPGHAMYFRRILHTADGNLLVFTNDYYTIANYAYAAMGMLKLDNNGNILWYRQFSNGYTEIADAVSTPDNGFVVALNDNYGSGAEDYSNVTRFDPNGNVLWRTQVTQPAYTPIYRAITCTQDAVFVGYDTYLYAYDEFGVDRLDLATGNMIYSRRHTAGTGTFVQVNSLFAINDSAYIFLYDNVSGTTTNLMVGLDKQGNIFRGLHLGADPMLPINDAVYGYLDATPPSVAITADQDFWLASRVSVSGADYVTVTHLKVDGTVESSKLHSAISGYQIYNTRPQGKGLILVGSLLAQHTGNDFFTNSFALKLDSTGQLQTGASANCVATDRPFPVTPCTTCGDVFEQPKTAGPPYTGTMTPASPYNQNNDMTSVLLCFQQGNCNTVNLKQKGPACALHDTLVYYLDNSANCGAAATWTYDPSILLPSMVTGDSIQLVVQKAGATSVGAQIEGYCSYSSQTIPVNIVLGGAPSLGLPADTVICTNGPISLQAAPGFASYLWNDNSTASSLQVSVPGQYSVVATDLCGNPQTASTLVTDANAAFHLTPDTIRCNSDIDTLRASVGYTDYQWSPGNNLQAFGNEALVTPGVTTLYTVTAQLSPGCTVTHSALVTALLSPPVSLGDDSSICSGDSLLLDAGLLFNSYSWSTGATGSKIYVSQAGVYSLSALYSNGCASRDTFQLLSLYTVAAPALNKDSVLCIGTDRALNAGPGYASYLWNDGSTGPSLDISQPGLYWVSVTDQHGCVAADTANVVAMVAPPAGFLVPDTSICQYGDLVISTLVPFAGYSWSDLSTGSSLTITQPGVYWVQVTDNNGCIAKDSILVSGKECLVGLFVPNAFTPNGDGHNDRFKPLYYGTAAHFDFAVFNRWGQKVFETQSPGGAGWDGTINGTPSPGGVYVWYCRYQPDGQPEAMAKGTVILIR